MGINFTVSETHEELVIWGVRFNCALSFAVDLLTIHLLWAKSPRTAGSYKYLLLIMQICSALIDMHIGLLFVPIPLFPIVGAYCTGLLCSIDVHICVVTFFFLVTGCLITLNLCVFYRHQEVLPSHHPLKLRNKPFRIALCILFAIACEVMSVLAYFSAHESSGKSAYLDKNHPAMVWITKKPHWIVYDPNASIKYVIYFMLVALPILGPVFLFLIRHIYSLLNQRISEMSSRTLRFHRAMIKSLVMQSLCWLFVCIPIAVWILSVLTEAIPHEVSSIAFLITELFPLVNATTMILNSPTFRHALLLYIRIRTPGDLLTQNSIQPRSISGVFTLT